MIKALLNGYDIYNVKEGSSGSESPVTGSLNSKMLIDNCEDISENFYTLSVTPSAVRFVYLENNIGHIGVYIGKEVQCGDSDTEVCNVVECTSSWSRGIQLSYVDEKGIRYNKKGGKSELKWIKHGLPTKWVEYNCQYIFNPQNASDCLLSSEDKKRYKYCCYDIIAFTNKCFPYNEQDYQIQLITIDTFKKNGFDSDFDCITENNEANDVSPESTNCENIKPKVASDCKLSEEDKKHFKYCCYEGFEGIEPSCGAYTQESYEEELKLYKAFKEIADDLYMECNLEGNKNSKDYFINYCYFWLLLIYLLF